MSKEILWVDDEPGKLGVQNDFLKEQDIK